MKTPVLLLLLTFFSNLLTAQPDRWQQRVKYKMDIDMDVTTNRFTGKQQLEYSNNSPDTLHRLFYHLYFNAFQPNSMMDTRSRELGKILLGRNQAGNNVYDWDERVRDRIQKLGPAEIGYQKILSLRMNGRAQKFRVHETILEVVLDQPILPRSTARLEMDFEAQVPLQIRRSGRDNPNTGVRYSMSQWYPKLCEYDYEGWHPTPYIAREFYGVWGDFDVSITIDKRYVLGGTGYLQNAAQVGHGYAPSGLKVVQPAGEKLTWHFTAPNVHDFVWAADPDYKHIVRQTDDGITIHVLYDSGVVTKLFEGLKPAEKEAFKTLDEYRKFVDEQWRKVANAAVIAFPFIQKHFGKYPYKQYSFIHGGDGGMEYPMATLVNGWGIGLAFHELMHSWYQMLLGTNESLYAWMDEGFASFAETLAMNYYQQQTGNTPASGTQGTGPRRQDPALPRINLHLDAYDSYFDLANSGFEEPLTTHADQFNTNYAYSRAAYSKGEVFLEQLGYIVGAATRDSILLEYYRQWRFKHPAVNDFMRIAEKVSGLQLDWYRSYFVNTTKTINYAIDSVWEEGEKTKIRLRNKSLMPMPIDLQLTFADGSQALHYIPMYLMFGEKPQEFPSVPRTVLEPWKWTHPTYIVEISRKMSDITRAEIDPTQRMADVNRIDNSWKK